MKNQDSIFLENLYQNLILFEDLESTLRQQINLLKNSGKQNPENIIENLKNGIDRIIQKRIQVIADVANQQKQENPTKTPPILQLETKKLGLNYKHLPILVKWHIQSNAPISELLSTYDIYMTNMSDDIRKFRANPQNILNINWDNFSEKMHQYQELTQNDTDDKKNDVEFKKEGVERGYEGFLKNPNMFDNDPNNVYYDENVSILCTTKENIQDSVKLNRYYGKYLDNSTMCISGPQALHYTASYRFKHGLTTYYVYFKKPKEALQKGSVYQGFKYRLLVEPVDHEVSSYDGDFNINSIDANNDSRVSTSDLISRFPDLKKPIERGVFKVIPKTEEEKEVEEIIEKATNINDFNPTIQNLIIYTLNGDPEITLYFSEIQNLEKRIIEKSGNSEIFKEYITFVVNNGVGIDQDIFEKYLNEKSKKRWEEQRTKKIFEYFA